MSTDDSAAVSNYAADDLAFLPPGAPCPVCAGKGVVRQHAPSSGVQYGPVLTPCPVCTDRQARP